MAVTAAERYEPVAYPALRLVAGGGLADAVEAAERALAARDYDGAADALADVRPTGVDDPSLAIRFAAAKAEAELELGAVDAAGVTIEAARRTAEDPRVGELQRATILFLLGCCRLASGQTADAASFLTLALDHVNRAPTPSDRLRALILERRARCHRQNRDWPAARVDVERALELAEAVRDEHAVAQASLQASVIAERERQWIVAEFYAERARSTFERVGDRLGVGKCLNNLGGLSFLLGRVDEARRALAESFRVLRELERDVEAAYALSSLAQVELRAGDATEAERLARRALAVLGARVDHATECGNAQIVLGRAVLAQGRLAEADEVLRAAEQTLERAAAGERAAVWLAQADVATARGDAVRAVDLCRRAAETLQDFHF